MCPPTVNIDEPFMVDLRRIQNLRDPFDSVVWPRTEQLTRGLIESALSQKSFRTSPWSLWPKAEQASIQAHAERIAYLIEEGWDDPIHLDFPGYPCQNILDGYHRIAAAIYMGRDQILVSVGGFTYEIEECLHVKAVWGSEPEFN